MKFFKCSEGTLINPGNVTHVTKENRKGNYIVRFTFINGNVRELLFSVANDAAREVMNFETHCEQYT